jgi:hypothetical protein
LALLPTFTYTQNNADVPAQPIPASIWCVHTAAVHAVSWSAGASLPCCWWRCPRLTRDDCLRPHACAMHGLVHGECHHVRAHLQHPAMRCSAAQRSPQPHPALQPPRTHCREEIREGVKQRWKHAGRTLLACRSSPSDPQDDHSLARIISADLRGARGRLPQFT